MAIQKINLGTEPLGEGGDTYRSANTKINENFSNTTHAASKLVGTGAGQVPLNSDVRRVYSEMPPTAYPSTGGDDLDEAEYGMRMWDLNKSSGTKPSSDWGAYSFVQTLRTASAEGFAVQLALPYGTVSGKTHGFAVRAKASGVWKPWCVMWHSENTTKDSKTNLLLASGSELPEDSAASRSVGTTKGKIPLAQDVLKAAYGYSLDSVITSEEIEDLRKLEAGTHVYVRNTVEGTPEIVGGEGGWTIETKFVNGGGGATPFHTQEATNLSSGRKLTRTMNLNSLSTNEYPWKEMSTSRATYQLTTGTAPNVVVDSDGVLKRSSSSAKYKDVITKLELDNDLYQKAMQVNPIVYRSKSDGDPKEWHYMSFLAEEIGELDPSLTQWLITTHDDEGNELDEPIKEAEGINLNAICAVLQATNIYQDKKIKELEQRLIALESINEIEPVEESIVEEVVEPEVVEEPTEEPVEDSK